MALTNKLTAIADAIRGKTGKTEEMTLDQMPLEIASIVAGGGSTLYTGIHKMEEWVAENVVFDTPGDVSYFAMFMIDAPTTGSGQALFTSIVGCKSTKRVIVSASNSSGSAVTASQHYITGTPTVSAYPGISFGENQVTLLAPKNPSTSTRWLQVNKEYVWVAW